MVDFGKRLAQKHAAKPLEPSKIYDLLDRASDKGPLRPAQVAILDEWHKSRRDERDTIVKLHTGQGKTLIGLLILQSKLNENGGSALYLCPNRFLVDQTAEQAKQFGVKHCTADEDLPDEFIEGKAILIASVQKLFNGLSKFRLDQSSLPVSSILMDDCHACIDAIRDCFTIRLSREDPVYQQILALFKETLEFQGAGTVIDIENKNPEAFLPIPYWKWQERHPEVLTILGKNTNQPGIKFVWPLIKNMIEHCQCIISGDALEIAPYLAPLEKFG
jgi:replicative superfamily II helicase